MILAAVATACSSPSQPASEPSTPTADSPSAAVRTPTYHNSPLQTGGAEASATDPADTNSVGTGSTADGLNYIGTFTNTSPGASVSTRISIGQPTPNTEARPPTDVLDACNWNYTTVIAQSVYIHGSITITYRGSIAEEVRIDNPGILNLANVLKFGAGSGGALGIQGPDGTWNGCGNSAAWVYALQPNSSVAADMWIDYPVLSNTQPTFTAADQQPLAIRFAAAALDPGGSISNTPTVSGPGAANCTTDGDNSTPTLLLYSTPPYSFRAEDINSNNHPGMCTPA